MFSSMWFVQQQYSFGQPVRLPFPNLLYDGPNNSGVWPIKLWLDRRWLVRCFPALYRARPPLYCLCREVLYTDKFSIQTKPYLQVYYFNYIHKPLPLAWLVQKLQQCKVGFWQQHNIFCATLSSSGLPQWLCRLDWVSQPATGSVSQSVSHPATGQQFCTLHSFHWMDL